MNSIMIDIETLDIASSAIVLSIGGCFFDLNTLETSKELLLKNSIYIELNSMEQELKGRTTSADTIFWWLKQSAPGLSKFSENNKLITIDKLKELIEFIIHNKITSIWSNSPSFDMIILESLFNDFNLKLPIDFRGWFDLRTAKLFRKLLKLPDLEFIGQRHNALDDAINQAVLVIDTLKTLKSNQFEERPVQQSLDLVVDLMD